MTRNTTLRVLTVDDECWDVSTFEQLQQVSKMFLTRFHNEGTIREPEVPNHYWVEEDDENLKKMNWCGISESEKAWMIQINDDLHKKLSVEKVFYALDLEFYNQVLNVVQGRPALKSVAKDDFEGYSARIMSQLEYRKVFFPEHKKFVKLATVEERSWYEPVTPFHESDVVVVMTPFEVWLKLGEMVLQPTFFEVQDGFDAYSCAE